MRYKSIFTFQNKVIKNVYHTPQHSKNEDRTKKTLCLSEQKKEI